MLRTVTLLNLMELKRRLRQVTIPLMYFVFYDKMIYYSIHNFVLNFYNIYDLCYLK